MIRLITHTAGVLITILGFSLGPPDDRAPAATAEDLAWMAGTWEGTLGNTACEEVWSAPRDGNITGMFRTFNEGGVRLSEIMSIQETDEGLLYRLRHFDAQLNPWPAELESPIVCRVEITGPRSASFKGLRHTNGVAEIRYESPDSDTLICFLSFENQPDALRIEFDRAD
ncbi:MAG: DUF6265 family protein [Planctomycetota bacterium]